MHAFLAEELDDVDLIAINLRAAHDEHASAGEALTGRRTVERNGVFLLGQRSIAGKIERVDLQQSGRCIEEREAGVIVVKRGLERRDDAPEESVGVARGDEQIVDLQENLQAVAFVGELLLRGFGGLEVKGIVDSDGDLSGDALHEVDLGRSDSLRNVAAETESAESMLRGGERKNCHGVNTGVLQALHEIGIARVLGGIENDERLLMLPNPARGNFVDGKFAVRLWLNRIVRLEDVKAHGVVGRFVKDQGEKVEGKDAVETLGKIVEEGFQVALLGDGFGDFEQGLDLAGRVVDG